MPVLKGKSHWAQIQKPSKWGRWEILVNEMDEGSIQVLKDSGLGHRIKEDDEYGVHVRLSQATHTRSGKANKQPKVVGPDPTKAFEGLIGNGSLVKVAYRTYDTNMGIGHALSGIQVLELVPYDDEGDSFSDETEDFEDFVEPEGVDELFGGPEEEEKTVED